MNVRRPARVSRFISSGGSLRSIRRIATSYVRRRLAVLKVQRVVADYGPCKMWADLRTSSGLFVYRYGMMSSDVRLVLEALQPGDCFLDGGANVGLFTMPAALRVGTEGSVISIEPGKVAESLHDNAVLNGFNNVSIVRVALDDGVGIRAFADLNGDAAGLSSFGREGEGAGPTVLVPTSTLDSVSEVCEGKIRVVKLDLEGAEVAALRGARRLLMEVPYFLVELENAHLEMQGSSAGELLSVFERAGYRRTTRATPPNVWFEKA